MLASSLATSEGEIGLLAESFLSRFEKITESLSLRSVVSRDEVMRVLREHDSIDARLKGLLGIRTLRLLGGSQIMTKLHEALVGERKCLDAQGATERLVAIGGVAFFAIDSRPRMVQVGVPSESLKVFLKRGLPVPTVYVLPPEEAPSYGDVEFPMFFNFFIQNAHKNEASRVVVIGQKHQLDKIRTVFRESMFGPENPDLNKDVCHSALEAGYSIDFTKEIRALSPTMLSVDDFALFVELDEQGIARLDDGIEVRIIHSALLEVYEADGKLRASLDLTVMQEDDDSGGDLDQMFDRGASEMLFCPPSFGVTFIGTSHGFDGSGRTTGFIVWIASRGIVVDPPVGTVEFLIRNRIHPSLIHDVILTHVHSDHCSGLAPLALRHPHRLTVHSFRSVYDGYMRKMKCLLSDPELLCDFNPVLARCETKLLGAMFEFDFSFHTLPTLRFVVAFGGRKIAYSCDTLFDLEKLKQFHESGVLNEPRYNALKDFVFREVDLLIHEAGVPPIHTPLANLEALPLSVRRRLRVVHCHGLGVDSTLQIPKTGFDETLVLPLSPICEGLSLAARLEQLVITSKLFSGLSGSALQRLMSQKLVVAFKRGDFMFRFGDQDDDRILMVVDGMCQIRNARKKNASRSNGVQLCESDFPDWPPSPIRIEDAPLCKIRPFCSENVSLVKQSHLSLAWSGRVLGVSRLMAAPPPRNADVKVVSDYLICLVWSGAEVKAALAMSGIEDRVSASAASQLQFQTFLQECARIPSSFLSRLSPEILEELSTMAELQSHAPHARVFREGSSAGGLYVIKEGSVIVVKGKMQVARLGVGEILGEMSLMSANKTRQASVFASEEGCSLVVFPAYPLQMLLDVPAMSSSLARRYAQNINRLSAMQMAHKQTK